MCPIFPEQFCWVATTTCFRFGWGCFGSNNVEFLLRQFREWFSIFSKPYCWIAAHTIFWGRFRVFPQPWCSNAAKTSFGIVPFYFRNNNDVLQLRQVLERSFLSNRSNNVEVQLRNLSANVLENFRGKTVENLPRHFLGKGASSSDAIMLNCSWVRVLEKF